MNIVDFVRQTSNTPWVKRGRELGEWDCWGLVYQYFKSCHNIILPIADGICGVDKPLSTKRTMIAEAGARGILIERGQECEGDVIFFRPCHCGIVVRYGQMFHCTEDHGTVLERYDNAIWLQRLTGIYRHEQLVTG